MTPELLSLQKRGLEIRTTTDFGPHKKYFPYCADATAHLLPLVTADDDVIYPRRWLSDLIECAAQEQEPTIVAHRSHRIKIREGSLMPYLSWGIGEGTTTPCYANMATGICGVLYPSAFTSKVATVWQTEFMEFAPRADDIWLHSRALLLGIPTKQVKEKAAKFVEHHPSSSVGLSVDNVAGGGNDSVIAKLYNSDLALKISLNVRSSQ